MKGTLLKFVIVCALVLPVTALARAAGDLSRPSLMFPADFPEATRTNILAALTDTDYKFAGGEFVNASTQLRYAGDTKALNLMLQRLSKCPNVTVRVSFVPRIEEDPDASWRVLHSPHGNSGGELDVQVNFHAEQIHLDELVIPEIKGPTGEIKVQ